MIYLRHTNNAKYTCVTKLNSSVDDDNAADLEEKSRTKKKKTRERGCG